MTTVIIPLVVACLMAVSFYVKHQEEASQNVGYQYRGNGSRGTHHRGNRHHHHKN